jgi:hypothetical protein
MSDRRDEVSPRVDSPRHLWVQPIVFFVTSCFVISHVSEFFLSRTVASEAAHVQTKQSKETPSQAKAKPSKQRTQKRSLGSSKDLETFRWVELFGVLKNYYKFDVTR